MTEFAHASPMDQVQDPLTRDLIQFAAIIETEQAVRAEGVGRRADPALNTAFGMLAAWNTLAAPENENTMPELRGRVAEYLATQNVAFKTLSSWKAPLSKLAYMSYDLLDELYAALPEACENTALLDSLDGLKQWRVKLAQRSRVGKLVFGGLRHVLGTEEPADS